MKFIAEKSQIVDSLQNAAAVAERRQTIPILANLRLKIVEGKLEVTATDLEIQIKNLFRFNRNSGRGRNYCICQENVRALQVFTRRREC